MKISEIVEILDAELLCSIAGASQINIAMACGADLMSDVLAFIKSETLLLTGLTTPQVIYTAENAGVSIICFVRGKEPGRDVIELAKEKEIVLLGTKFSMFESCGKLYVNGLVGCYETTKL